MQDGAPGAKGLAADLEAAASALIAVIDRIEPERWTRVPALPAWSVGKDAEHVAEAAAYHQWIVRLTIGDPVPAKRPAIHRKQLTTAMSPSEVNALIRRRTDEAVSLISKLSDDEMALPTRPPRPRERALAVMIERVFVGHIHRHRREIERKLRDLA